MTAAVLLLAAATAAGAGVQVSASVDRAQVVVGDPFRLTVVVTGAASDVADPRIPQVPGLEFYAAGRAQNVSIVNGQVSSSVNFQYSVVARSPGRLVIPSIAVASEGKTWATNPIQVVAQAAGAPQQPGTASPARPSAPAAFVTGSVDKRRVFVGEQVVYTFRFHYRVQLASQPRFAPPDLSGFVIEDLQPRQSQVNEQGAGYWVSEVRYALFPTAPGTATIGAGTLQVAVVDPGAGGDPFSMFFGGGRTMTLKSDPVAVTVLPLPEAGKPAGFTGAVGSYRLSASLDRESVEAGKPVTLTVEIKGTGLVKSLREPVWPEIPGARRYETLSSLNVRNAGDLIQGSKTFKAMLIPQTSGKMTIPPIRYPVFDPETRRYVPLVSPPLRLTVKPGAAGAVAGLAIPGLVPAAGVRAVNEDIRFLKAEARLAPARPPLCATPAFGWLQLLPALFFLSGLASAWRRAAIARNPAAIRARRALRAAGRRLKASAAAARKGEALAVHSAVQETLAGYLADKWDVSPSGLTLLGIQARLREAGVPGEPIGQLVRFWEEADLIRYAPQAASDADLAARLGEVRSLLGDLEKVL